MLFTVTFVLLSHGFVLYVLQYLSLPLCASVQHKQLINYQLIRGILACHIK